MKFNLAKLFNTVSVVVDDADYVLTRAQFYMQTVDSSTLTGPQKLDAVKAALETDLKLAKPELVPEFDALWTALAPAISGLVTLFRLTGELAPVVKAVGAIAAAV